MADLLGMDPARIARLRAPERLEDFNPAHLWDVIEALEHRPVIRAALDIGAGVGYLALPLARRYPAAVVYGCDVLEGMVGLLRRAAEEEGLANLRALHMQPDHIDVAASSADLIVMGQVHHELDAPASLLDECRRLLAPGGVIAIADWKDEDNGKSPAAGRRIPEAVIGEQLEAAGFADVRSHDIYRFHSVLTARRQVAAGAQ